MYNNNVSRYLGDTTGKALATQLLMKRRTGMNEALATRKLSGWPS